VDVDQIVALDEQIHALVYQVAAPTALPPAVRSLDEEVRRGIASALRNQVRTARVQREHHALLAAFECRDAEGAATVASDHMQNALNGAILRQNRVSDAG
jgi:DNA-binding GntR family transcriptional regulator